MKKILLSTALSALMASQTLSAQEYTPSYKIIDAPGYYSEDLAVSEYNVLDYGIDNTGTQDCTTEVQKLLDACGGVGIGHTTRGDYRNPTGGTIYFPAGRYLFKGQIVIPRGVSIRGDWKRPTPENGKVEGTIFAVQPTRGKGVTSHTYAFIVMQPTSQISNVSFWYPDQNPASIKKYPATVLYGQNGYWGNDYCSVRHCTFVNSYIGIQINPDNGGGCPNITDICGTPLYEGMEIDGLGDVGRFDGIDFAASYWENSGLEGAPSVGQIDQWLYDNATGMVMRRNDWSYTCNFTVKGYKVGFHAEASPKEGRPNGHNYGFDFDRCRTGVLITSSSGAGIMFTEVNTRDCDTGVKMLPGGDGPILFYGCKIDARKEAIHMDADATAALLFQDCEVNGPTKVEGNHFQAVNNTFSSNVTIGPKARTILADNKFTGNAGVINNSLFKCVNETSTGKTYPKLPKYEKSWMTLRATMPARKALYVVTDAEFGATPFTDIAIEPSTQPDCAPAIQKALDKAGAEGGGIVYLPKGHYPCRSELTIPTGVELKGSADIRTVPKNHGSVLEVLVGEGNEDGTPFINMAKGSGLRGLTINYPGQNSPINVRPYPYTVRGNADCYIVNLAMRTAYRGLDLFTNKCDRHYVDYLAGHVFKNVVRIGGDSEDGVFNNTQCNTIAFGCGDETKFGHWPNSLDMADNRLQDAAGYQNKRDLEFLIVGDCSREILYNNFLFGCNKGFWFIPDKKGGARDCRSLGNAVDAAVDAFVIDGIVTDLDLINSQIVALPLNPSQTTDFSYLESTFIKTGSGIKGRTVNFLSTNNWGSGEYMTDVASGTVNVAMTNMFASGAKSTFKVADGAKVNVFNGRFNNMNRTLADNSVAPRTSVHSSIIKFVGGSVPDEMDWKHNLTPTWEFEDLSGLLPRNGWTATASVNNGSAQLAIDGVSSTRWAAGAQQPGQWFAVNFNKPLSFNAIIMDSTPSGNNDGPAAYKVEVYKDGGWVEVASGTDGSANCIALFEPQTATQVRITQTGTKTNYWSINEFNVADFDFSDLDETIVAENLPALRIAEGSIMTPADCMVEVYTLTGQMVALIPTTDSRADISALVPGLYIAVARTEEGNAVLKFRKK